MVTKKLKDYESLLDRFLSEKITPDEYTIGYFKIRDSDEGIMIDMSVYTIPEVELIGEMFSAAEEYCGDGNSPGKGYSDIDLDELLSLSKEHLVTLRGLIEIDNQQK